jgi:hypothetical protein
MGWSSNRACRAELRTASGPNRIPVSNAPLPTPPVIPFHATGFRPMRRECGRSRFLVPIREASGVPLRVVVNWQAGLKG